MANKLANTANLILVCLFYSPLIPGAPLVALFGMIFSYWVDKYLLLRRNRRPEEMSGMLVHFFANLLPWMTFLWGVSTVFFTNNLQRNYNEAYESQQGGIIDESAEDNNPTQEITWVNFLPLIVTSVYILLPIRSLINKLFGEGEEDEVQPYKNNFMAFMTDYDRANPVTKKDGVIRLLNARKELMQEEFDKELEGLDEEEKAAKIEE